MAKKKGKSLAPILIIAVLTAVAGIVLLLWLSGKPPQKETREVLVYFSDEEGLFLKAERRAIEKGDTLSEARGAMEALVKGPVNAALANPLPAGTRLLGLAIDGSTAFVDLSPEVIRNHEGGSSGEIQTVFSIVNTLTLNFPEIKGVQILVGGKKEETIAGHIDITTALGPDKKIVKD